jgi:hypothetical protein
VEVGAMIQAQVAQAKAVAPPKLIFWLVKVM